jgi:predicted DNA-binding transcriptional regulator AlpA
MRRKDTLGAAKEKYRICIKDAQKRDIPFQLSFEEWFQIWQDSGHWQERGCHKGQYVMHRFGDTGPYALGNVTIIRHEDNVTGPPASGCPSPMLIAKIRTKKVQQPKESPVELDAYSIAEFCARHSISRCTFYNLDRDGKAPKTFRVGSRRLISKEAAAAWRAKLEHADER